MQTLTRPSQENRTKISRVFVCLVLGKWWLVQCKAVPHYKTNVKHHWNSGFRTVEIVEMVLFSGHLKAPISLQWSSFSGDAFKTLCMGEKIGYLASQRKDHFCLPNCAPAYQARNRLSISYLCMTAFFQNHIKFDLKTDIDKRNLQ